MRKCLLVSLLLVGIVVVAFLVAIAFGITSTPAGQNLMSRIGLFSRFKGEAPEIYPPVGVMLENELMSRPFQKGLSSASTVYEAPTEGRITRFLAIFDPNKMPERMGPIRSARTYFLDWIHEYNGVYTHVGGNNDALARLRKEKIFNADQFIFEKDKYFWREGTNRTALEHTMFTSGEQLIQLMDDQKWYRIPSEKRYVGDLDLDEYPKVSAIKIDFGSQTYSVDYEYDPVLGKYLRSQNRAPHIDHNNDKQITVNTIAVQRVKTWSNNDAEGSISMKTIGTGEAVVFTQGYAVKGYWKKDLLDSPTRFYDEKDNEVPLDNPTWIEVLPVENTLAY